MTSLSRNLWDKLLFWKAACIAGCHINTRARLQSPLWMIWVQITDSQEGMLIFRLTAAAAFHPCARVPSSSKQDTVSLKNMRATLHLQVQDRASKIAASDSQQFQSQQIQTNRSICSTPACSQGGLTMDSHPGRHHEAAREGFIAIRSNSRAKDVYGAGTSQGYLCPLQG